MYVYIRSEPQLWTVGHYGDDGRFVPESDHGSPNDAALRVNALNGGMDMDTYDVIASLKSEIKHLRLTIRVLTIRLLNGESGGDD